MQPRNAGVEISICNLKEKDLKRADYIIREAFSSHLGISPSEFAPGQDLAAHYWVEPEGAFAAYEAAELAGVIFATTWGSFAFFGPLCVSSSHWNKGIAQLLLNETDKYFKERGINISGLYTFSDSAKHIRLYERYGYHPQMLTANLVKKLDTQNKTASVAPEVKRLSMLEKNLQAAALDDMDKLTNKVFPGLALSAEARNSIPSETGHQSLISETVLIYQNDRLKAFALCPMPPQEIDSEKKAVYAKFAIADADSDANLTLLINGLERYAAMVEASQIRASTNTARRACYKGMLAHGFTVEGYGIAMIRPDTAGYNRPEVFVFDDWR